jgi:hypothetical protein
MYGETTTRRNRKIGSTPFNHDPTIPFIMLVPVVAKG